MKPLSSAWLQHIFNQTASDPTDEPMFGFPKQPSYLRPPSFLLEPPKSSTEPNEEHTPNDTTPK
jgi:hypothetical protein